MNRLLSSGLACRWIFLVVDCDTPRCLNNCGIGDIRIPQEIFSNYLTPVFFPRLVASMLSYLDLSRLLASLLICLKPILPLVVISPASLTHLALVTVYWLSLRLATMNLSATRLRVGGQGYYYPFTPYPANRSTFRQWTTTSVDCLTRTPPLLSFAVGVASPILLT